MLAVAQEKAKTRNLHNVEFLASDAEQLDLEPASFDAVLCRGALCLIPDTHRCLRIAYEALKAGGHIAVAVIGDPQRNAYFTTAVAILAKYAQLPKIDPEAPGPFRFASPERLQSVLTEAGFRDVHIEQLSHTSQLGTGHEYWEYVRGFSVVSSILAQIPVEQHDEIGEEIESVAAGGDPDGEINLPTELNLGAGVR